MPRIRIARIGAAMAGLWFAALAAGQQPEPVSPGGPRLQLTPLQWNFGEVWQGEPLEFELTVASVGDAPLHITRVDPSCGCTTLTKPRDVLNPGESDKLVVKFDAVKRRGPQNTRIVFASDDPAQPNAQFVITGNVKPVYEIKPVDSLSFGKLYRGTQDARTVTITNLYTEPMRARLKPGQDYRPYEVSLKEIEPGRKYEVTARTLPPLGVGVQRTTVMFETGIPRLPEVEIITYGTVHPPIEIETARLMVSRTAPRGVQHVLPVLRDPAEPVRVVSAKASHESVKVEIREKPSQTEPDAPPVQELVVQMPPGNQLPAGDELSIEVQTDARDAAFQKLTLPVRIVAPRPAGAAPATTQPAPATP